MKKTLSAILIFGILFSFGCAGKHPSDVIAPVIIKTTQVYHLANQTMIALYDVCKMQGDRCPDALKPIVTNWNQIDDRCDQIDIALMKAQDLWLDVSRLKSPESIEEFNRQWMIVSRLIDELVSLVPGLKTAKLQTPFGGAMIDDLKMPEFVFGGEK